MVYLGTLCTVQYSAVLPSTAKCIPVRSTTAQHSPVQCSTAQYSPVHLGYPHHPGHFWQRYDMPSTTWSSLIIRWSWWGMVLWARLAFALFIHRSRNFYLDYHSATQIIIRIITLLHGLYIKICFPQKTFPTSYNPTVFDTYPTDMVLADPEKTVSYQMLVSS